MKPAPAPRGKALELREAARVQEEHVADALARIGKLGDVNIDPIVEADEQWRYRNKVEYSFWRAGRRAGARLSPRGRWDEVLDIEDCHLSSEATNRARNEVLAGRGPKASTPTTPVTTAASCATWSSAKAAGPGRSRPGWSPRAPTSPSRQSTFTRSSTVPPVRLPDPPGYSARKSCGERIFDLDIELSHDAFFQTNTEMAEKLYGLAAEYAGLTGNEKLFDLFCGVGTIGLSMARQAGQVWGLEIVPEAIENAKRNAKANGITNARFVAANARTGMRP